ncbi:MAG: hypothetical protein JWN72_1346 [Thermoleophilia bacterium]|nr:hypothetical protein [Thermoleophilia bacterium]
MSRSIRTTTILAVTLVAVAVAAPAAFARKGGDSAPTPTPTAPAPTAPTAPAPTPAPEPVYVDYCADPTIVNVALPDEVLVNAAGAAGCIAVRVHNGVFSVAAMVLAPGWTYSAKSSTTGGDRVKLELTDGRTDITYLVEPGKTWIR